MSTTAEDLKRRIQRAGSSVQALRARIARVSEQPDADTPSASEAFLDRMPRTILNNLLAAPDASGELVANATNLGRAVVGKMARIGINNARALVGMERKPNPSIGERYDAAPETEGVVQKAYRAVPRPTIEGVDAALLSVPAVVPGGESPGEAYDRNLAQFKAYETQLRTEHPIASTAGDIAGDVASLFIGRRSSGADRFMVRLEERLTGKAGTAALEASRSTANDLGRVLKGPRMQMLARGAGRSVEAGVEAAVLDILKDPNADPLETAALAAGGQMAGSAFLAGAKGLGKGGLIGLTAAAATTAGFLQVMKSSTPGGDNRILESIESAYDKVALGLGLGLASAAIGTVRYGRVNTANSEQTRLLFDAMATVHRGTTLSLLTDWTEGDDKDRATIERVLTAIAADPGFKGKSDAERAIVRRLRDGAELKPVQYRTGGAF